MIQRGPALVALEIALLLTTGLVVGRSSIRRIATVLLVIACVLVPLALPAEPAWVRFVLSLASLASILRSIEVLRDSREHGVAMRMFAFVAPLDAFAIARAEPRIDLRGLGFVLLTSIIAAIGFSIVVVAPIGSLRWPVAIVGGTIGTYAASDASSAAVRALLRAVGIEMPAIQRDPIRSRSVAEFWGKRWNRAVGSWLQKQVFMPLARRRRVGLGLLAAFTASAAIHFWPVLVAVGWLPAIAMGSFFMLQAVLVVIETRLGVTRWPAWAGHVWTVSVMLATSPLFIVPFLLVIGFR